ncbi:MAG TPA: cyclic nucleotide-binding domain-containing protein [Pyrinomonadaceae bacterium]
MAVASPRPPARPIAHAAGRTLPVAHKQSPAEPEAEWWIKPLSWVALAVFIAVPVFAHLVQSLAGRVVWTIVVASLPFFIVLVGYHRWRRICPLAFFAQIPVRLRRPGTKKASPWLEANYYYVAFAVFFFSLWLRLIATNGDGHAISAFFVLISAAALLFGAFYTGKTWCNYVCPLSFIEKIYTEPHGLRETDNSQCAKCSACKKFCPDINEENGYWKEIESRPKRFVYFAFPGLVFGFYFYYFLQAGNWDYYFGGSWTNEPMLIHTALMPGHDAHSAGFFFLPIVPRAVASILTLAACGLLSFLFFSALEPLVGKWLRRREAEADAARVRHVMFTMAAFTAFLTFYSFAGQPSLRKIPGIHASHFVLIAVVLTGTLFLVRRLRRTQKTFAEETLARNIIRRWEWTDIQPPKDLHEAFLIHTIKSRETAKGSAQVLEIYKDAVREALANGFVTREEIHLLESLRNQMQIKKTDHEKIMASLAEEERALLSDPSKQISAEKRLQLTTYANALKNYLEHVFAAEDEPDDSFIVQLRSEYRVTKEEHAAVLDELLGGSGGMASRLAEELSAIERAAQTIKVLELQPSASHDFLADLLRRRRARAVENLMRGISFTLDDGKAGDVRDALCSLDDSKRESIVEQLRASLPPAIAERLLLAYRETVEIETSLPTLTDMLFMRLQNPDPYVRAVALHALGERGAANEKTLDQMSQDEHELVRETAQHLKKSQESETGEVGSHKALSTVEKMIALRSAPIFSRLPPEGLAELARASREAEFAAGANLCLEGEPGNEVFILLAGEVEVFIRKGEEEQLVNREKAGAFIGEMAVLDPAPRSATVRAASSGTRVLRLDGDAFRNVLNDDPTIAYGVIRTLAQRLRKKM